MSYRVVIKPSAEKDLARLPQSVAGRVIQRLESLQETPRPKGAKKLAKTDSTYRIRVGDYRIVYEIDDAGDSVYVTIIAHRREVYRGI